MAPGCAAPEAGSKDRPELGLLCCSRALLLQQFHELVNGEIRLSDERSQSASLQLWVIRD